MLGEEAAYGITQKIIPASESTSVTEVALNFSISALLIVHSHWIGKQVEYLWSCFCVTFKNTMKKRSEVQRGFSYVGAYTVWIAQDKEELWTHFGHLDCNSQWSAISILQILKQDLGLRNTPKDKHLNTDF